MTLNITDGDIEEAFLAEVLGSGEEHFDVDGNSEQLSKLSDDQYGVFRIEALLEAKKRVQKYNIKGEITDTFLTNFYNFITGQAPLAGSQYYHTL